MDALSERRKPMKVQLVNYTSDAVDLLLFTKNTRLMDDDDAYDKISQWDEDKKKAYLARHKPREDRLGSSLTTHSTFVKSVVGSPISL